MINFFRRIRQKLLKEHKLGQYLTYAIGEILLVVIGILIALSINNWNQKNIDRKAELYYLDQMKSDLVTDSLFLTEVATNLESRLPIIQEFLKVLYEEDDQEAFNLGVKEYIDNVLVAVFFVTNSTTFNEMESSGKLGIIRDKELRKHIISAYNQIDVTKNIFSLNREFMRPVDTKVISDLGMAKYQKYQNDLFAPYISKEELYNVQGLREELISNVANWNWTIVDMLPAIAAQISELRNIIRKIDNYLEQN